MEPLKIIDNFFETTSLARQIDEGIQYLEEKLGNVKSFGLSVNPEETRIIAKTKLEKIESEINEYKNEIDSLIELEKRTHEDVVDYDKQISEFHRNLHSELWKMELAFRANAKYEPYQPVTEDQEDEDDASVTNDNNHEIVESEPNPLDESSNTTFEIRKQPISLNSPEDRFASPMPTSDYMKIARKYQRFKVDSDINRSITELQPDILKNSSAKKLNLRADILKTSVDSRLSAKSMECFTKKRDN